MNAQFKRGIVELCVLAMLVEKDSYGYEIISELSKFVDVSENAIYPILRRLTKEENFKTYLQASNEGAPRKYYQMTDKGFNHYVALRDQWDRFIGGVYHIIQKGGKNNDELYRKFKERIR